MWVLYGTALGALHETSCGAIDEKAHYATNFGPSLVWNCSSGITIEGEILLGFYHFWS